MNVVKLLFALTALLVTFPLFAADTLRLHDGTASTTNQARASWEESLILSPNGPCTLVGVRIYYGSGSGTDTIRITGDASEGTIPPTQYCYSYNTLARVELNVASAGWHEVDLREYNIRLGGYDRVVVQHIQPLGGPSWAMDAGQTGATTSFLYDAITPNPNFFNIPGIYYLASGDYLVDLIVEYEYEERPAPTWTDVTTAMGIVNAEGARFRSALATTADINNDGYDDLVIGTTSYINSRDGSGFTRKPLGIQASNTVWADIDGDGDLDCFAVFANGTPDRKDGFYVNDGDGNLTEAPGEGIDNEAPTVTPLFLDFDHDGDLDVFVANGRRTVNGSEVYFQDKLFRNDGDWTFVDVTASSGIAAGERAPYYDTWGASLTDVNMDGWTDIFVATYRLAPDRLYINNHDGTFTESSASTGVIGVPTAQPNFYGHGMGSDWADIDNDGDMDLAVGNLGHPDQRGQFSNPSLLFRNVGTPSNPSFENWYSSNDGVLDWHGITFREMNAGMCFADFDQDGKQDLFHAQYSYDRYGAGATRPAHFYLQGEDRFIDRGWETGLFIHGSWTAVRLDYDRDGDFDLLVASPQQEVRLFRNDLVKRGNSLVMRLHNGVFADAPEDGYGSTVKVFVGDDIFTRQLPGTVIGGRCSQMTQDLHFGIGEHESVDSVQVMWPGGVVVSYPGALFEVNTVNTVEAIPSVINAPVVPQQVSPQQHAVNVGTKPLMGVRAITYPAIIQIAESPDFENVIAEQSGVRMSTELEAELNSGTTYHWRARFDDQGPPGRWSSTWQFTVGAPAPRAVTITSPTNDVTGVPLEPTITWTTATFSSWQQPAVSYEVEVLLGEDLLCSHTTTDTSWMSCKLEPLITYTVRVRAVTENADGAWSQNASFTTYGTPTSISLTVPEDQAVNIPKRPRFEWEAHEWADGGYEIEYGLTDDFVDATSKTRTSNAYPVIKALETGRLYYWRVRGLNEAGMGAWSDSRSFTVEGVVSVRETNPEPPTKAYAYEAFDLQGRRLQGAVTSNLNDYTAKGVTIVVWKDKTGSVLRSDVIVR